MHPRSRHALLGAGTAAAALILAGCNLAERDNDGAIVEAGDVGIGHVKIGDCYDDAPGAVEGETIEVASVDAIPCADPHDNEVYAIYDLEDGEFPGEDVVIDMSFAGCVERFAGFAGAAFESVTLDVGIIFPVEETWDSSREVVCSAYDPAGPLTGSLEGHGDTYRVAGVGECVDDAGLTIGCDVAHYAEIFHEAELEGDAFPGAEAVDEQTFSMCQAEFAEYVGLDWESSELDFVYWAPDEASWAAGYTLASCAIIDPTGADLTGSVQGSGR